MNDIDFPAAVVEASTSSEDDLWIVTVYWPEHVRP